MLFARKRSFIAVIHAVGALAVAGGVQAQTQQPQKNNIYYQLQSLLQQK